MREATYSISPRGLATSFVESELPLEYASEFRNRLINAAGGAEKRQGIAQLDVALPGAETVTGYHDLVDKDGTVTEFASGGGKIYRKDSTVLWTLVYTMPSTGRLFSVQIAGKLIFANGLDRQVYTTDGATFAELLALLEQGTMVSGSTTTFNDTDISALGGWTATAVAVNIGDLVYNATVSGYGIITAVAAASVAHTAISSGGTGLGKVTSNSSAGHRYQITDLVELNIIPTTSVDDNVAAAGAGTNATTIAVSGVNFSTTDVRRGDIIHNTTRSAIMAVSAIATALTVTSVASQVAGDSLVFYKSAMPIAAAQHVHFNRLYMADARDQRKVRITGANDPQDMTTDGSTLDPVTVNFDNASRGDIVKAIGSFQRFLVLAGRRGTYIYQGTVPVGTDADFEVVGSFPVGVVSRLGLMNIGNDLLLLSDDGVQSIRLIIETGGVQKANISEPVRLSMRPLIVANTEDDLQLAAYPRRSLVLVKLGTEIYVYNYATGIIDAGNPFGGSWARWDGPIAQQSVYFVRYTGDLICGGGSGRIFEFDQGDYSDDGQAIYTEYKTGWLTLEETDKSRGSIRRKEWKFLKALLQGQGSIMVTFSAEGDWEGTGNDTNTLSTTGFTAPIGDFEIGSDPIGGSLTASIKRPLRGRGEVMRLTITTNTTLGPDILGRYTVYHNLLGRR